LEEGRKLNPGSRGFGKTKEQTWAQNAKKKQGQKYSVEKRATTPERFFGYGNRPENLNKICTNKEIVEIKAWTLEK